MCTTLRVSPTSFICEDKSLQLFTVHDRGTAQDVPLWLNFRVTCTPVYSCVASRGSIHTVTLSTGTTLPPSILSSMSAGMSRFHVALSTTLSCSSLFTCKHTIMRPVHISQSCFPVFPVRLKSNWSGHRGQGGTPNNELVQQLTVIWGKVFFMRLNIFLWDCRSPMVRGSLAPSLVLPFDVSFRPFSSRTVFTWRRKKQLTSHLLFDGSTCTPVVSLETIKIIASIAQGQSCNGELISCQLLN